MSRSCAGLPKRSWRSRYNRITVRTLTMFTDAETLKDEGLRLFRIGDHTQALDHFERAYDAHMQAGRPLDAAEMLNNIGVVYRMDGGSKKLPSPWSERGSASPSTATTAVRRRRWATWPR